MHILFIPQGRGPCTTKGKMNVMASEGVQCLITPYCSIALWGFVGPVAVLLACWCFRFLWWGVPLLVGGSPDRDGQYFSPREVYGIQVGWPGNQDTEAMEGAGTLTQKIGRAHV